MNTPAPGILIRSILIILLTTAFQVLRSQPYDLIIINGHLIDPAHQINAPMDIAIREGKVALVSRDIPEDQGLKLIDAAGMYVVPGLIDMHVHVFHGTEPNAHWKQLHQCTPGCVQFPVRGNHCGRCRQLRLAEF